MQLPLTILVPTRNRPAFLRRLLTYFKAIPPAAIIRIIDSSQGASLRENRLTVQSFADALQLEHVEDSTGMISKCRKAMERVETPYTAFCADDDFLMLDAVQKCLQFLETHPDYHCAMGSWVWMNPDRQNRCHQTRCTSIDDDDPTLRMRRLANHWFSTFYGVYRTASFRRAWIVTDEASDYDRARVFPETLLSMLSVLYGKLAVLPHVYYLFELHDANEHRNLPLFLDAPARIELYQKFETALTREIQQFSGQTESQARTLVRNHYSFWETEAPPELAPVKGLKKLVRSLRKELWVLRDRIVRNPVDVWLRRRVGEKHPLLASDYWRAGFALAAQYPKGIPSEEAATGTRAA